MDAQLQTHNGNAIVPASRLSPANGESDSAITLPIDDAGFEQIHFFSDDPESKLVGALREYGATVLEHRLDSGFATFADMTNAVIVMDVSHLSQSFSFCRQLRARGIDFPLVTLTLSTDPFDEVLALELGTDEVIGRHVHPRVLLARLHAISRRALSVRADVPPLALRFGELHVDGENRNVTLRDKRIGTTSGEFDLLWLLARNAGHVIRRDEVLTRLRGLTGSHTSRSVDARLYRLRQRFVDVPDIATRIKSVRPYGYMFVNAAW